MVYVMVKHKVQDFSKWKMVFDRDESILKEGGCQRMGLYRDTVDANLLVVFLEFDRIENAQKFSQGDRLKQVMQQAGVIGQPEMIFLNQIEKKSLQPLKNEKVA